MMRIVLAFLLSLLALPAFAQIDPRQNVGNTPPGVVVKRSNSSSTGDKFSGSVLLGERAPEFTLLAAGGAPYRLKDARGRWTALFFTDRRDDLGRLSALAETLDSLHFQTIVVLNEHVQSLASWRTASSSSIIALADETGEISMLYGLWDHERGTSRPGLFVLDPAGVVKLEILGQKVSAASIGPLVQSASEGL
jgi:peroxiredoxin